MQRSHEHLEPALSGLPEPSVVPAAVAAVADGRGVVLTGGEGCGRTTTARAVAAALPPDRFAITWVVGTRAGAGADLGAFAGTLPPSGSRSASPPSAGGSATPSQLAGEVGAGLARRAAGRWPVLVVDDAHLLDAASAALVLCLAVEGRVRLLVTARTGSDEGSATACPGPDAVITLWKDGYLSRLELTPLDHGQVGALLAAQLGGPVAPGSIELLRQWTRGNPRYLTELLRHGRAAGLLRRQGGLWWWDAPLVVPAAVEELVGRRLDALPADARNALAVLALAEPVPADLLFAAVPAACVVALEDAGLVRAWPAPGGAGADRPPDPGQHLRDPVDLFGFAHPVLAAAVRERVTPARRRVAAQALVDARAGGAGTAVPDVTLARWCLELPHTGDADLLHRASVQTLHADPPLAARFARRAVERGGGVDALIALADALIECGEPEQARSVLDRADQAALGHAAADDRRALAIAQAGYRAWSGRDPDGALTDLARLPPHVECDSLAALVRLFAGRPADALTTADRVLGAADTADPASGTTAARQRAGLARAAALVLVGRTSDAVDAAERLRAELAEHGTDLPYATGMADAALALARLWRGAADAVPATHHRSGRWPAGTDRGIEQGIEQGIERGIDQRGADTTGWSLFDGYERRIRGDLHGAAQRLREALVQQSAGEALFRSEAAAWLAITLAELGEGDEAAAVLATTPPDRIAVVPGLLPWAQGLLAGRRGDVDGAVAALADAAAAARDVGALLVELGYLLTAVEVGGPDDDALERIGELVVRVDAPRLIALAEGVLSMRSVSPGSAPTLAPVADRLEQTGVYGRALDVAIVARRQARGLRARAEADARVARLRARVERRRGGDRPAGLTEREHEVAELALRGLTDQEIADRLVVSIRTVQTHLARVYRKLGVRSRRHLPAVLESGRSAASAS